MKSLSKITALVAGGVIAVALGAFSLSPVLADSPGQLEGGSIVYEVKDLTTSGSYSPAISAAACNEVEYSIRLHNTSYGGFADVKASVNLPSNSSTSNSSTVTATTDLGGTTGTTATATVNLSSAQTVNYENGTTVLYGGSGNVIKTLPDTITTSGVDIGGLNGSTTEFVNFKAKVSCPAPAPTPTPTPAVVVPAAATKTTVLPNTGPGDVFEMFAGASTVGAAGHYFVSKRRK